MGAALPRRVPTVAPTRGTSLRRHFRRRLLRLQRPVNLRSCGFLLAATPRRAWRDSSECKLRRRDGRLRHRFRRRRFTERRSMDSNRVRGRSRRARFTHRRQRIHVSEHVKPRERGAASTARRRPPSPIRRIPITDRHRRRAHRATAHCFITCTRITHHSPRARDRPRRPSPARHFVGARPLRHVPRRDDLAHALRRPRRLSLGVVVGDQTRVPRSRQGVPSRRVVVVPARGRRHVRENLARVRRAQESRLASGVRRRRARADDEEVIRRVLARVEPGERELATTTGV